jgi:3-hydroxyisobutyrate dehydrogenase-like beta-hydroxyacid dehydrogenase
MTIVGVVGLGTMGGAMARHALNAGFDLRVHDRTRSLEEPLAALGAARAATPAEVAQGADLLLTCVPDDPHLEAAVTGPDGIASTIREGAVLVDCSTVSPTVERRIAEALLERGALMVDAPVSGGSEGAENGTLTIFCGGDAEAISRARPLLESFGKKITTMGGVGMGQAAKAVNQIFTAGAYAGLGEALVYGQQAGLPMSHLVEALTGGAADSWVLRNRSANVIDGSYPLGFRLWMHLKDIRIGLAEADKLGVDMPVTRLVADLEQRLVDAGYADDDVSALARIPRQEA